MTSEHVDKADATRATSAPEPISPAPAPFAETPQASWMMLQGVIGNAAVGRLYEASKRASGEGVVPLSPHTQQGIDSQRGRGRSLDEGTRAEMQEATGREMPRDVLLHEGPEAANLVRGLGARAFTQGKDVFLGQDRSSNTAAGRETLAHELTHAAQGQTSAGTAQLDGDPRPPSEATTGPNGEERYTLTMTDGVHQELTKEAALGLLNQNYGYIQREFDLYRGEWDMIQKNRKTLFGAVGGWLTDLGGSDFPTYAECWDPAEHDLLDAHKGLYDKDVKAAAEALKKSFSSLIKGEAVFKAYKDQLDDAGKTAERQIEFAAIVAVTVIAVGGALLAGGAEATAAGGGTTAAGTETAGATTTEATATATETSETATTTAESAPKPVEGGQPTQPGGGQPTQPGAGQPTQPGGGQPTQVGGGGGGQPVPEAEGPPSPRNSAGSKQEN